MKKIIALALVFGLTSVFAAGTPKSPRAATVDKPEKTYTAKKVSKAKKAKKAKRAKRVEAAQ